MAARLPLFDALESLVRDDDSLKLRKQKEEFQRMIERECKWSMSTTATLKAL